MRIIGKGRTRIVAILATVALAGGIGAAVAAGSSPTPSNAMSAGRGIDEFGLTQASFKGHSTQFTYTKGFFCDRHVKSAASSKCEAGKKFQHAPKGGHDPLYITVPLGFHTRAGGAREWWDVRMVGITDRSVYRDINKHKSAGYLLKQVKAGRTTGVIPTNLFLFFAVK
jgi:hypothetical protein